MHKHVISYTQIYQFILSTSLGTPLQEFMVYKINITQHLIAMTGCLYYGLMNIFVDVPNVFC